MAGGQHHAFADAELHFAWRQVRHQHGEFADQVFWFIRAGDAAEDVAHAALAGVERQAQQFGRAIDRLAVHDPGNAQVDLAEVFDADGSSNRLAAWQQFLWFRCGRRFKQRFELLDVDALHQVLVVADGVSRAQRLFDTGKSQRRNGQEVFHLRGQQWQHRFEVGGERGKGFDADAADIVQSRFHAGELGQFPGFVGVHVFVHAIGQQHGFAQALGVVAFLVQRLDAGARGAQQRQQCAAVGGDGAELAVKALGDEAGGAGGDVDVLADQVAVDARHEVFRVELDVFVAAVELGGDVVAQPLGVHAQAQVFEWVQTGAAALAHFLGVDGQKAVHKDRVRCLAAAEMQRGGPEQRVKGHDVLADEVVLLGRRVGQKGLVVLRAERGVTSEFDEAVFERSQVADWRVEPDVEVLARRVRNLDAEVGRVA